MDFVKQNDDHSDLATVEIFDGWPALECSKWKMWNKTPSDSYFEALCALIGLLLKRDQALLISISQDVRLERQLRSIYMAAISSTSTPNGY